MDRSGPPKNLNTSSIISQRLRNHALSSPTFKQPVDVVHWFGAVQAQDFHGAKWALALRMQKASHARVEEAFNRGEILRTHLLRPTWHFIAPEDIRWLLELTAPRVNARCGPNYRKFELDAAAFKRSNRVITSALKGGKHLTRSELKAALNRAGIAADDTVRMAHILVRAELDGVVCSGPRKGKQFTYALLEERVAVAGKALSRDESLAELTRRYFMSHGPATLPDFVWWSGLTTNDARRGIALVERELDKVTVDQTVYWSGAAVSARAVKRSFHAAHLLPAFDEYNVAYKDRQLAIDGASGLTTWDALGQVVVLDGRLIGTWKPTVEKQSIEIAVTSRRTFNKQEKLAVTKAAERYAAFLDLSLNLSFG